MQGCKMEKRKMVILGAGSAMFTQGLIADLISNPLGYEWELALVDIDEKVLASISKIAVKMVEQKRAGIRITASADRLEVLPGADYVVATIGVGGRRAWEQDVFIPRKYGIEQPVGDTMMPGGISRAMRMVPVMTAIAGDVERLCPQAYFFNYSNPMAIICRAIDKAGYRAIGLCHSYNQIENYLARYINVRRDRFKCYGVGINHLCFLYDIRYKGRDARPLILEKYREMKERGLVYEQCGQLWFDEFDDAANQVAEPFAFEMLERFQAFPCAGDRHISEFFTEYFPGGRYYGKVLGRDAFSFERCIAYGDKIYDDMLALAEGDAAVPEALFDRAEGEHEQLMEIIDSIENDVPRVFGAIMPNRNAVPNLPAYAAIEMACLANARGMQQIVTTDFPEVLAGIVNRFLAIVEVSVDAALKGDKTLFVEAIMMGGYMHDRRVVEKMVDELLVAHKENLPQF